MGDSHPGLRIRNSFNYPDLAFHFDLKRGPDPALLVTKFNFSLIEKNKSNLDLEPLALRSGE
jgi:hypothetical protein